MGEAPITIRSAIPEDADGITCVYMESAEYHASLDPKRYWLPAVETTEARYRDGQWHSQDAGQQSVTLVAELSGEIVGFVDAQLQQSPDPMHRAITYCHIVEIAVSTRHQNQSIGERLLSTAEEWGRQQGAELASLEFLAVNTRAATFYQRRMGYRPASITAIKRL
jgi:ribosomal protein S18 acetylase RimI-like enzyme